MENNKKIKILYLIISFLFLLLLVFAFMLGRNSNKEIEKESEPADIIEEEIIAGEEDGFDLSDEEQARIELIKSSRIEVEGADLITPDNKVINTEGNSVRTDISPTQSGAPTQTKPIIREELPESVIDIEVSLGQFNPDSFTVKAGSAITLSLSSIDSYGHSLVFRDPLLQAIGISVKDGETRAMTFNAPEIPGEYEFYCSVGGDKVGHVVRGEVGKMIVE